MHLKFEKKYLSHLIKFQTHNQIPGSALVLFEFDFQQSISNAFKKAWYTE